MSRSVSSKDHNSLRLFFLKVNKNSSFRAKFLADPAKVLAAEGITLSPDAEKEVIGLTKVFLRRLPELAVVPTGFDALLAEVAKEGSAKGSDDDPAMLIL